MRRLFMVVWLLGLVSLVAQANMSLDIANVANSTIDFSGGNFTFTNDSAGYSFQITDGGTGAAISLFGNITGTFNIGAITSALTPLGTLQSAPVTGAGTLKIYEGLVPTFASAVDWVGIFTLGRAGAINSSGALNLLGMSYSGSNPDLLELARAVDGSATLSFQFDRFVTLTSLKTTGGVTSYSGSLSSIVSVPEPASMLSLSTALLLIGAILKRKSRNGN